MWDPTNEHNGSTTCWYVITIYLLFVLCKGMMVDWFRPKHVPKAYKRECKLVSDWAFIFFVYWVLINKYTNIWLQLPAYLTKICTTPHVVCCVIQFFLNTANKVETHSRMYYEIILYMYVTKRANVQYKIICLLHGLCLLLNIPAIFGWTSNCRNFATEIPDKPS